MLHRSMCSCADSCEDTVNRCKHRNRHIDRPWMSLDTPAQMAMWTGKAIYCCASLQAGNKCVCVSLPLNILFQHFQSSSGLDC